MEQIDKASYDAILAKCDYTGRDIPGMVKHQLCRATFIECVVRLSKYIYCDIVDAKDLKEETAEGAEFERIPLDRALLFFIRDHLKTYFLDQGLNRMEFKEEQLITYEIDMVYSMNQVSIKAVHKKYAITNATFKKHKTDARPALTKDECHKLVIKDLQIDCSRKQVNEAYAQSKQIVLNE